MISDEQKRAVVRSWKLVGPIAETAADLFYRRLFEIRPAYKSLFPPDLREQKRKLVKMLGFIVSALDWSGAAWQETPDVEDDLFLVMLALGRRHRALYRIPDDSYEPVGEALLWTLDQGIGEAFTPEVREAWSHVYQLVARTMKIGASAVIADQGPVGALERRLRTSQGE